MVVENQSIVLENVLSYRTRVEVSGLIPLIKHVFENIGEMKLNVAGDLVLSVFESVPSANSTILGVELILPVEKPFESNCHYIFKPHFRIDNALFTKCCGKLSALSEARRKLYVYALENNFPVLTKVYYEVKQFSGDYIAANAYLGINANLL